MTTRMTDAAPIMSLWYCSTVEEGELGYDGAWSDSGKLQAGAEGGQLMR
jgi:hypothetical protein